jgi:hypothetical protein
VVSIEGISGTVGLDDGGTGADLSAGQGVLVQATSGANVSSLGGTGILKLASGAPSVASLAAADLPTGTLKTDAAISSTLQAVKDAAGNASAFKLFDDGFGMGSTLKVGVSGTAAILRMKRADGTSAFVGIEFLSDAGSLQVFTGYSYGGLEYRFNAFASGTSIQLMGNSQPVVHVTQNRKLGFYNTTPVSKPTVSGSRGGNAALASLCTALANLGLITDSTT